MIDRFDSALWKVDRARNHADDLEEEVRAFWGTHPFEVEMTGDPFSGSGSFHVKRMDAIPTKVALIAGDAAHNIRAALDHFAWAAVPPDCQGSQVYFPIWSGPSAPTPNKWRKQISKQLAGARPELIERIANLEPWEGGRDSLLRDIHDLDRIDKHRLLLQVAVAFTGIGLNGQSYELAVAKKFSGMKSG